MEPHETDALKVLERVNEKVLAIDQHNNKQLETLLLWKGMHKSKQERLAEKKKNWKYMNENNKQPPTSKKWMQEDEQKNLRLRSRNIQIEDTALGQHKQTQVRQFEASLDTTSHQEQEDWFTETQSHEKG